MIVHNSLRKIVRRKWKYILGQEKKAGCPNFHESTLPYTQWDPFFSFFFFLDETWRGCDCCFHGYWRSVSQPYPRFNGYDRLYLPNVGSKFSWVLFQKLAENSPLLKPHMNWLPTTVVLYTWIQEVPHTLLQYKTTKDLWYSSSYTNVGKEDIWGWCGREVRVRGAECGCGIRAGQFLPAPRGRFF